MIWGVVDLKSKKIVREVGCNGGDRSSLPPQRDSDVLLIVTLHLIITFHRLSFPEHPKELASGESDLMIP